MQQAQPAPLVGRACQAATKLVAALPAPVRSLLSARPEVMRPAAVRVVSARPSARPAPLPALPHVEIGVREAVRRAEPPPLVARACEAAEKLLPSAPVPVRSLMPAQLDVMRPIAGRAAAPSQPARPAALPPTPATVALEAVEERLLGEPHQPEIRSPYVPGALGGAGGLRSVPIPASAVVLRPIHAQLTQTCGRAVELPAGARAAAIPALLPTPPAVRARVAAHVPTPARAMPMVMPRHLPPAHVMAIVLVLGISLAAITGYYAYGPGPRGSQAGAAMGTGGASMAMMETGGDRAYEVIVKDVWRDAMTALEHFGLVVAGGDLSEIADAAGETRVQFDVLAIDVRYARPPEAMESAHRALLTAIERTATMLHWAEALAADPLDEDAVTRNAELFSVAAQQARAAYEEAEAGLSDRRVRTSVWDEMGRIAALVRERRAGETEASDRPRSVRAWEAGSSMRGLSSDSPTRGRQRP
ncbi:MAG: hypothetical protein ACE5JM_00810 [Armatimonadota bacterium]